MSNNICNRKKKKKELPQKGFIHQENNKGEARATDIISNGEWTMPVPVKTNKSTI